MTSAKCSPAVPSLPTISEAGVLGYEAGTWSGLLVPHGTSHEVITRLHDSAVRALSTPDVRRRLDATGYEAIGSTPEQFAAFVRTEIDKRRSMVKASGARVD